MDITGRLSLLYLIQRVSGSPVRYIICNYRQVHLIICSIYVCCFIGCREALTLCPPPPSWILEKVRWPAGRLWHRTSVGQDCSSAGLSFTFPIRLDYTACYDCGTMNSSTWRAVKSTHEKAWRLVFSNICKTQTQDDFAKWWVCLKNLSLPLSFTFLDGTLGNKNNDRRAWQTERLILLLALLKNVLTADSLLASYWQSFFCSRRQVKSQTKQTNRCSDWFENIIWNFKMEPWWFIKCLIDWHFVEL